MLHFQGTTNSDEEAGVLHFQSRVTLENIMIQNVDGDYSYCTDDEESKMGCLSSRFDVPAISVVPFSTVLCKNRYTQQLSGR
jgi:hypothetical protein